MGNGSLLIAPFQAAARAHPLAGGFMALTLCPAPRSNRWRAAAEPRSLNGPYHDK